jgi:hypothetical protein
METLLPQRIALEPDERVRSNLELVQQHYLAEIRADVDTVMSTLGADPHYEYRGTVLGATEPFAVDGSEAVRQIYDQGVENGGIRHEYELSLVTADRNAVVTEGVIRHAFAGGLVSELAMAFDGEIERDRWYLVEYPALVVWPFGEGGLLEGERVYFGDRPRVLRALDAGERPDLVPEGRSAGDWDPASASWATAS